jgi:hypothetical protein|tara:strand:+ start:1184 stop:1534 length:351 start_codon:yes stop_codon:yes gene_type:complete
MKILNNTNEMVKYLSEEEETMLRQINLYIGCKVERGTEGQPWDIDPEEYYEVFKGVKGTVISTGEVGVKNIYLKGSDLLAGYNNMENSTPIPFILKQLERNADSPVIGRLWASINK